MNAFDGLINTLDTTKERNSEFEAMSTETSQTEKQTEKRIKTTEYVHITDITS